MNILELDRFMTRAAEQALMKEFAGIDGQAGHARHVMRKWQDAFKDGDMHKMGLCVAAAERCTGQPAEVCRRWLSAYAPVCAVWTSLRLVD
jgi:hypothetical protein